MVESFLPTPGSIVACRDRQWVVLTSEIPEVIRLRPLSGSKLPAVAEYSYGGGLQEGREMKQPCMGRGAGVRVI